MKITTEWLTERVEQAPTNYHLTVLPATALKIRMAWQKLKMHARDGDELWAFSSPPVGGTYAGKHSGYALVRGGRIVEVAAPER
jgi:hypothetical protein